LHVHVTCVYVHGVHVRAYCGCLHGMRSAAGYGYSLTDVCMRRRVRVCCRHKLKTPHDSRAQAQRSRRRRSWRRARRIDHGAELGNHVSATSAPFVANSFNLGAKIHGAETYYLSATVHGAEPRVHFLKPFQKRRSCENLLAKGSENEKDGPFAQ
jgi:hypothetical protein